jgi:carbon monoxide dehydrogenase subunit G
MEVKLEKRYPLNASVAQAWAVLSDIRATAACMPGATITEQLDDTHFKGTVKSKVGPATMNFGGDIEVLGLDAATYSMQMLGKGADRSGSSASMNLSSQIVAGDSPGTSVLVGNATVVVSGKLAQFGSRLLVPVSEAILGQFAGHFETAAAAIPVATPAVEVPPSEIPQSPPASHDTSVVADESTALTTSHPVEHRAPAPAPAPSVSAVTPIAAPKPAGELNALALLWILIKGWFAGLFGKKP